MARHNQCINDRIEKVYGCLRLLIVGGVMHQVLLCDRKFKCFETNNLNRIRNVFTKLTIYLIEDQSCMVRK